MPAPQSWDESLAWPSKPAPCDKCNLRPKCAIENTACLDFYRYVTFDDSWPDTKVRNPTKEYYTRIYRVSGYERNRTAALDDQASGNLVATDAANGY